jgi:beta-lactamase class A
MGLRGKHIITLDLNQPAQALERESFPKNDQPNRRDFIRFSGEAGVGLAVIIAGLAKKTSARQEQAPAQTNKNNPALTPAYGAILAQASGIDLAVQYRDWLNHYIGYKIRKENASIKIVKLHGGDFAVIGIGDGSEMSAQRLCVIGASYDVDRQETPCRIDSTQFEQCYHLKYQQSDNYDSVFQTYSALLKDTRLDREFKQFLAIEELGGGRGMKTQFVLTSRGYWTESEVAEKVKKYAPDGITPSVIPDALCSILISPQFGEGLQKVAAGKPTEQQRNEQFANINQKLAAKNDASVANSPIQQQIAYAAIVNTTPTTTISVMSYDFEHNKLITAVKPDELLQAASAIKVYVALAYLTEYSLGHVSMDLYAARALRDMLQNSSNPATDFLIKRLDGPAKVDQLLKMHYLDLFPKTHIEEYIGVRGKTYRNKSTAREYTKYYMALWHEALPFSKELTRLLGLPSNIRINTQGDGVPAIAGAINKTGTTSQAYEDTGFLNFIMKGVQFAYSLTCIWEHDPKKANLREDPNPYIKLTAQSYPSSPPAKQGRTQLLAGIARLISLHMTGKPDPISK